MYVSSLYHTIYKFINKNKSVFQVIDNNCFQFNKKYLNN